MKDSQKPIDVISEGPVRDLLLAINHYLSTGDRIGEGVAMEAKNGDILVNLAYDPKNPDDLADYHRFRRRIAEIMDARRDLPLMVEEPDVQGGQFRIALLHVKPGDLRRLAQELVRSCGEAGWGTCKVVIDQHAPEVRAKILSGEGV